MILESGRTKLSKIENISPIEVIKQNLNYNESLPPNQRKPMLHDQWQPKLNLVHNLNHIYCIFDLYYSIQRIIVNKTYEFSFF